MLGWAPPLRPFGFPLASLGFFSHHRPPETLISGFILLRASTLLQSIPHLARHPSSRRSDSFHEVSLPLRAVMGRIRRCFGFHTVAAVRPQVFSTSRRFPPRLHSAVLFHPAKHVQALPFRVFSSSGAVSLHQRPLPSWGFAGATGRYRATASTIHFKALLSRRVRCGRVPVKVVVRSFPSWVFSSSGCSSL